MSANDFHFLLLFLFLLFSTFLFLLAGLYVKINSLGNAIEEIKELLKNKV